MRWKEALMSTDAQHLADANACHDSEPQRAAGLLSDIDAAALAEADRPLYAFLLNHVLGEKLGQWGAAQQRLSLLLAAAGAAAPLVLWRQAAVAAMLSGDSDAACEAAAALARAAGASLGQTQDLIRLAAAAFQVPACDAAAAAATTLQALLPLQAPPWQTASALDTPAAACSNNLAAHLSERPTAQLQLPPLREAALQAALCSQRLWQRAGNWVNHERACYGVAVAAGAAGDEQLQHEAAVEGLALLDRHDTAGEESVDRAFLELERAHALQRLGRHVQADAARSRADALAAAFGDDALTDWYRGRVERHRQLTPG